MANVLATLFTDIANAIRNKTGTTAKMSPNDFPIQINNIVVGGDGDGSDKQWKFARGEITSTGGAMTITHNLGAIPDIVYVKMEKTQADTNTNYLLSTVQFSNAMIEAFNGNGDWSEKGLGVVMSQALGVIQLTLEDGVDGAHTSFGGMYGAIRNANATTFTVGGGSMTPIPSGRTVTWWAVSGIT